MTNRQAITRIIKDPERIRRTIAQMITDAYHHRAKRRTRSKWQHARPMNWRELRALPYPEYLKTKHWDDTRIKARFDADYTCQECGATNCMLHVHHLTYKRRGRERQRDLRVLCAGCHKGVHRK